ncbi:MAG: response regulator transcription factor [Bryobacteraceae bacterium]
MRILLIDDDRELCSLLEELLKREHYEVEMEHDGARGLQHALQKPPDIIVLDVMLPAVDGFDVLRELRKTARTPVIMLTARGEDVDRIIGLELGADDYLPKPFNPRELIARIRAILRRVELAANPSGHRLEVNGVVLDPASRVVTSNGKAVVLTTLEFDILEMLMRAAGRVLSRDALMENMYNRKATPFDRSIDMHVSHLRRKLGNDALIKTVRGVGYQFSRTFEEAAE